MRAALATVRLSSPALAPVPSFPSPAFFFSGSRAPSLSRGRLPEKRAAPPRVWADFLAVILLPEMRRGAFSYRRHIQGTALWFSNSEILVCSS